MIVFWCESRQAFGVLRDALGKDFDGDVPRQARIVGAVDRAHAAGAERAADLVRTEPGSRHKGQGKAGLVQGA